LDEFRSIFSKLKDADLIRIIKVYNLAPPEMIAGRTAPKGPALVTLMWDAASAQRTRMEKRS
jgi:hypothetical protein